MTNEELRTKRCYAAGCGALVNSEYLMCRSHWAMVPMPVQDVVIRTLLKWKNGGPGRPYLIAILRARLAVAVAEGKDATVGDVLTKGIENLERADDDTQPSKENEEQ